VPKHFLPAKNEGEPTGGANPRPFGTSGRASAGPASRAEVMSEGSGNSSPGTFQKQMRALLLFHAFIFIGIVCVSSNLRADEKSPALCLYTFSVIDAKTGQAINDFTCKFPATKATDKVPHSALPTNMTLSRDKNKAVFACITDGPVTVTISAPGYENFLALLAPTGYVTGTIPLDFRKVELNKTK
jgi:hypothetical protein